MRIFKISFLFTLILTIFVACDDVTEIGNSLVKDQIEIVMDSSFTVTGKTVDIGNVASRTATQLLGSIEAKGFGKLSSDFVAQFMPAVELETSGVAAETIDSVKLVMRIPLEGFVGDSLTPMGVNVYKLTKQLPSSIYSDFDPAEYYNPSEVLASTIYNASAISRSDSIAKLTYRTIDVKLPVSFGREMYQKYVDSPSTYSNLDEFVSFFPGLYVTNSYGEGRIMKIAQTKIQFFYRRNLVVDEKDTTLYANANYFAVTPEVINNNNIHLALESSVEKLEKEGKTIVVAPIGKEVEITFPTQEIINKFNESPKSLKVINSLSFQIPVDIIENEYDIAPPAQLLMVLKSKRADFFSSRSINDDKTSFFANYDSTTKSYTFAGLREYIVDMIEKGTVTAEDVTFSITPVSVTTETSNNYYSSTTYTTSICPYVEQPAMAILNLAKAKIKFTFTKQNAVF